ncbi:MAG: hypothetical protein WKG07_22500 [Hymenobacter sp.]
MVNQQYDCARLRRPLIQASVFTEVVSKAIEGVMIEPRVIQIFASEIANEGKTNIYFGSNGIALTSKSFSFPDMTYRYWDGYSASLDVTKIEARMWSISTVFNLY